MKNWERFADGEKASEAIVAEKILMVVVWAQLVWLYMDYLPDESRIDYLRRLDKARIMKSEGYKELRKLEKAERAAKKAERGCCPSHCPSTARTSETGGAE